MTNNIRKLVVLSTVIALGFLIMTPIANAQATKRRQRTASRKTSVPARRTNKSTTPSLDDQAFAFFMNFFWKRFARCGDSYICVGGMGMNGPYHPEWHPGEIYHGKGEIVMDRVDLTEADRLNGVEYLGIPHFKLRLGRQKESRSETWSPWESNRYYEPSPRFTSRGRDSDTGLHVRKMNGQWEEYWKVENSFQHEMWLKVPPPPCSVLPD